MCAVGKRKAVRAAVGPGSVEFVEKGEEFLVGRRVQVRFAGRVTGAVARGRGRSFGQAQQFTQAVLPLWRRLGIVEEAA